MFCTKKKYFLLILIKIKLIWEEGKSSDLNELVACKRTEFDGI